MLTVGVVLNGGMRLLGHTPHPFPLLVADRLQWKGGEGQTDWEGLPFSLLLFGLEPGYSAPGSAVLGCIKAVLLCWLLKLVQFNSTRKGQVLLGLPSTPPSFQMLGLIFKESAFTRNHFRPDKTA